jgi:hypothetical protein
MNGQSDRMPLGKAQWRLARVWFSEAGIVLILIIARSVLQHTYSCTGCDPNAPFAWFASAFGPTLLLIAGAISGTDDQAASDATVASQAVALTLGVSVFYFLVALIPVLTTYNDPAGAFKNALWIPAIQGIVVLLMSRLFAGRAEKKQEAPPKV